MQKRVLIPAFALMVGAGLLSSGRQVIAFEAGEVHNSLVQKFAEKFGRSEAEVQAVFDEVRTEHHQQMAFFFDERLDAAVANGELTEDQKQLIEEKHTELLQQHQADRELHATLSPEERRAERQAERDELEAWAEENSIDLLYFGGSTMHGPRGRMH